MQNMRLKRSLLSYVDRRHLKHSRRDLERQSAPSEAIHILILILVPILILILILITDIDIIKITNGIVNIGQIFLEGGEA